MHVILRALRKLDRLKPFNPAKAKRRRGIVRLVGFAVSITLGTGTCAAYSSASTSANDGALGFGRELSKMGDLIGDEPHRISLNGETIWMSSSSTTQDVKTVLDRFEVHCLANQGASLDLWRQLEAKLPPTKSIPTQTNPLTSMRTEGKGEGTVMCLTKTDFQNKNGFRAGLDFVKTSDLGHLGALRYVYVSRAQDGKATNVLFAWTEGHFKLNSLYPQADGEDVPGSDSELAPRPAGKSLRILSAKLDHTPYGVRVYQSEIGTVHEVFAHYDGVMKQRGFGRIIDSTKPDMGREYMKGGVLVVIGANIDPNGGTAVTIGDLGGSDFVTAPTKID
jgi:hypothetical protein